jgi:hypothetical protein
MVASPGKIRGQFLKAMLVVMMIDRARSVGDDLKEQLCAALFQGQVPHFVQKC